MATKHGLYLCADPHLGHTNIADFRDNARSCQHNTDLFVKEYKERVNKRTLVWFLGDVAFNQESLDIISELPGRKRLIMGNHDDLPPQSYTDVFERVRGLTKWHEFWLSHEPIHPLELRGKLNVHGHVHNATLKDPRYINVCPDNLQNITPWTYLISINDLRDMAKIHYRRCRFSQMGIVQPKLYDRL